MFIIVSHKVIVCVFSVIHNYISTVRCYFVCYQKGNLFVTFSVYHPRWKKKPPKTPNQTSDYKCIVVHLVERVKLKKKKKSH